MDLIPYDESIDDYRGRNRPLLRGDRRGGAIGGYGGDEDGKGIHVHVHLDGRELRGSSVGGGRRGRYSRRGYDYEDPEYPDAPDALDYEEPEYPDRPDAEDDPRRYRRRALPGGVGPPPQGAPDPAVQAKVQSALTGRASIGAPPSGPPPAGALGGRMAMSGIGPPPFEGGYGGSMPMVSGGAVGPPPVDIQYLTPGASTALVPAGACGPPPLEMPAPGVPNGLGLQVAPALAPEMLEMGITPPALAEPGLPKEPMEVICPNCGRQVFSTVKHKMGSGSWVVTCAICVFGAGAFSWLGVMPCCLKDCQDSHHTCPDCQAELGTRKFLF